MEVIKVRIFKNRKLEIFKYGEVYRIHYFSDERNINHENTRSRITKNLNFVRAIIGEIK